MSDQDRRLTRRRSSTSSSPLDVRRLTVHEDRGREGTALWRFDSAEILGIRIEDGDVDDMEEDAADEGRAEELRKPWNLRLRTTTTTPASENGHRIGATVKVTVTDVGNVSNGGFEETVVTTNDRKVAQKSLRSRDGGVKKNKKKERAKLWISLSREEIEEDIFILTGSKPARRPKRRPKTLQRRLNIVFPGVSLLGATAESFKNP